MCRGMSEHLDLLPAGHGLKDWSSISPSNGKIELALYGAADLIWHTTTREPLKLKKEKKPIIVE